MNIFYNFKWFRQCIGGPWYKTKASWHQGVPTGGQIIEKTERMPSYPHEADQEVYYGQFQFYK